MKTTNDKQNIVVLHSNGGKTYYKGSAYDYSCENGTVYILLAGEVVTSYDSDTLYNILINGQ